MASITFNYDDKTRDYIKEANDYLNGLPPGNPPLSVKERLISILKSEIVGVLAQKRGTVNQEDEAAYRGTLNSEVTIT